MRLFVAIDIPESVKQSLLQLRDNSIPTARWVTADKMHLTLRFVGEVDEKTALKYQSVLDTVTVPPFSIRVKGVGQFPKNEQKSARVLWAGVDAPPELFELQQSVSAALESAGLAADDYDEYSAHITLARLKLRKRDASVSNFLAQHKNLSIASFPVTEFALYESQLSSQGAQYTKVRVYPLIDNLSCL